MDEGEEEEEKEEEEEERECLHLSPAPPAPTTTTSYVWSTIVYLEVNDSLSFPSMAKKRLNVLLQEDSNPRVESLDARESIN